MRITGNEELNLEAGKDIVFFLGQEFSLEGTNLFKIIPNLKGKSYVINDSGYDLKKLCPYYNVQTVFLEVGNQLVDEAVYLFIQVNNSDLGKIKKIIDRRSVKSKNHILLNNPELYYYFMDLLKDSNVSIHLPVLESHNPINVVSVPKEENPFYYHNLFGVKTYVDHYWGDILEDKLGVKNTKGHLYYYFENIYKEKKTELETALKYKIPSKSIDLAIDKFKSRPLTVKENIEKCIMEGDYDQLPELTETLINQDNGQFNTIYDWVKYLECKAPNKVIQSILENVLKSDDVVIDNRFLPLVYEKLAISYQKEGDFKSAAKAYRRFSVLENINGELKNICSNFMRKEVELLYLAGEYQEIINIGVEEKLSLLGSDDAPHVALCLALAHNELGNYEKAGQYLKGDAEEKEFLRNIFKLNKGEIKAADLVKPSGFSKIALYNEMLTAIAMMKDGQYLDTIKVFNRMKEILGKPQNLIGRRALLIVSLLKARALKNIGNIRESLNEYYNNLAAHHDDFERENRSVVLEMIFEIAESEKSMDNLSKSLEYVEKGLVYKIEDEHIYDIKARIKLLLVKLEIINGLGKEDSEVVALLDSILNERRELPEFRPLQAKMNNILVKAYINNCRVGDGLELVESSYEKYHEETDKDIEICLLDMLELAKEQYMQTDAKDKGSIQLQRIIDKYTSNANPDIRIRTALAMKEMADYKLSIGEDDKAMEYYSRLKEEYGSNKYKKLEGVLQDTIIRQGEILFNKGQYDVARSSIMEIEGKLDSDIDADRELLLAKCNEKLGNAELAIGGFEEYLYKIEDKNISDENKVKVYKTLSKLLAGLGKNSKAIEYIDILLELENVPMGRLEAMLDKGRLLYESDRNKGYDVYRETINTFGENSDNNIIERMINGCSKVISEFCSKDMPLYMDILKKALGKFGKLPKETKANIFESMRSAADKLEEMNKPVEEKELRKEIVKYFGDAETADYQIESAYNYYRILEINMQANKQVDLESSCADFKTFFLGKEDDYVKDCYYQGLLLFGKEYLKRNEYKNAKKILGELLNLNKEMYIAKLYYGKALNALGEKKKALKEFKEIVDHDISGELFEAVVEKIKLIKSHKSLFGGNIKKLIKEIEERINPIINTSGSNTNKIIIGYELALLYKEIKNNDKTQELLKGLIEKYSKYGDAELLDNLQVVYKELEE